MRAVPILGGSLAAFVLEGCASMNAQHRTATVRYRWRGFGPARGSARWLLDENPSPEQVAMDSDRAVARILSEFPPERAGAARSTEAIG